MLKEGLRSFTISIEGMENREINTIRCAMEKYAGDYVIELSAKSMELTVRKINIETVDAEDVEKSPFEDELIYGGYLASVYYTKGDHSEDWSHNSIFEDISAYPRRSRQRRKPVFDDLNSNESDWESTKKDTKVSAHDIW